MRGLGLPDRQLFDERAGLPPSPIPREQARGLLRRQQIGLNPLSSTVITQGPGGNRSETYGGLEGYMVFCYTGARKLPPIETCVVSLEHLAAIAPPTSVDETRRIGNGG